MKLHIILSAFMLVTLVSACDSTPPKSKIENPLAGHAEALDKAKNLEKQLLDKHNKVIEENNIK